MKIEIISHDMLMKDAIDLVCEIEKISKNSLVISIINQELSDKLKIMRTSFVSRPELELVENKIKKDETDSF